MTLADFQKQFLRDVYNNQHGTAYKIVNAINPAMRNKELVLMRKSN